MRRFFYIGPAEYVKWEIKKLPGHNLTNKNINITIDNTTYNIPHTGEVFGYIGYISDYLTKPYNPTWITLFGYGTLIIIAPLQEP